MFWNQIPSIDLWAVHTLLPQTNHSMHASTPGDITHRGTMWQPDRPPSPHPPMHRKAASALFADTLGTMCITQTHSISNVLTSSSHKNIPSHRKVNPDWLSTHALWQIVQSYLILQAPPVTIMLSWIPDMWTFLANVCLPHNMSNRRRGRRIYLV